MASPRTKCDLVSNQCMAKIWNSRTVQISDEEIRKLIADDVTLEELASEERMSRMDGIRNTAFGRATDHQEGVALKSHKESDQLARGDLVLLRRLTQDNQRSHKLEPR